MLDVEQYMSLEKRKLQVSYYLGKNVTIQIDRPIGTPHPKHNEILYPINYGYIPGVLGGDHEELDVYLLGVNEIVSTYDVKIIAIVHRFDDVEDKLVGAPVEADFSKEEIKSMIHFQEQFYNTHLEIVDEYKFMNKEELSTLKNERLLYAENKYGNKYLLHETHDKSKQYFRKLEKHYIDHPDPLINLLHVIYNEDDIVAVYEWPNENITFDDINNIND